MVHLFGCVFSYLAEKVFGHRVASLRVVFEEDGCGSQLAEYGAVRPPLRPQHASPWKPNQPQVEIRVVRSVMPEEGLPVPEILVKLSAAVHRAGEAR